MRFFTVSERHSVDGFKNIINVPAGTYTVRVIWKKLTGTGTMNVDGTDAYSIEAEEIGPGVGVET
jgi:hypothetical protein